MSETPQNRAGIKSIRLESCHAPGIPSASESWLPLFYFENRKSAARQNDTERTIKNLSGPPRVGQVLNKAILDRAIHFHLPGPRPVICAWV